MQINETLIRSVVAQVLAEVARNGAPVAGKSFTGRNGIFTCPDEAVAAARDAFEQLQERTIEDRKRIIDHIRRISIEQCVELGTMEMHETKIGRLEHKIEKLNYKDIYPETGATGAGATALHGGDGAVLLPPVHEKGTPDAQGGGTPEGLA